MSSLWCYAHLVIESHIAYCILDQAQIEESKSNPDTGDPRIPDQKIHIPSAVYHSFYIPCPLQYSSWIGFWILSMEYFPGFYHSSAYVVRKRYKYCLLNNFFVIFTIEYRKVFTQLNSGIFPPGWKRDS